jgi:ATP-dependent helicase/nuclease subunit A
MSELPDSQARLSASEDFGKSVFIEAGAGTGKTETIVTRIVNRIITESDFSMADLAAITFTEKAGAELRNRFRSVFGKKLEKATSEQSERIHRAIGMVDAAAIGTIHAFCKRILTENSIEAELPVGFLVGSEGQGPVQRTNRARRVADLVWSSFSQSEQALLSQAKLSPEAMQLIVESLDKRFAIINELETHVVSEEVGEDFESLVYAFIHRVITQLKLAQRTRRNSGEIEFDDLLIMTRDLLKNNSKLRDAISEKYKVILVDEFQDTDPVQWEIVRLITAVSSENPTPKAGSLVLVGDPKQSIYRFRNADLNTFLEVKSNFSETDVSEPDSFGVVRDLSSNFRSVGPVIRFVNWLFGANSDEGNNPLNLGVTYKNLDSVHDPLDDNTGPAVRIIKYSESRPKKLARKEFRFTALEIKKVIDEKYKVTKKADNHTRIYRKEPATFADICILIPNRNHLSDLIKALAKARIPFMSTDPQIVFNTSLVAGLLNALRVIAQTDDDMHLMGALKSPLFALNDEQLYRYISAPGGNWDIDGNSIGGDSEVSHAMNLLYTTGQDLGRFSPFRIFSHLLEQQSIFEKLVGERNGDFEASALRMVLAHAAGWEAQGNYGLLEYLNEVDLLLRDSSKGNLAKPDDMDINAVQIMTIHASKGLEFPIVVLTSVSPPTQALISPQVLISRTGEIQFSLGSKKFTTEDGKTKEIKFQSQGYEELKHFEEKIAGRQEKARLLYVAMTRAQDHLILSTLFHNVTALGAQLKSAIEANGQAPENLFEYFEPSEQQISAKEESEDEGIEDGDTDSQAIYIDLPEDDISEFQENSFITRVVSPSSDDAVKMSVLSRAEIEGYEDEDTAQNDLLNEDWDSVGESIMASRDGRPLGNALHGVMDMIMRLGRVPDDEQLQSFVWQMCSKENILNEISTVLRRVMLLLKSPIVLEALDSSQRWPELHLAISDPVDKIKVAEGFADLVFMAEDGLVLVDYKTDKDINLKKREHYQQQLGSYSIILEKITGQKPSRVLILHVLDNRVELIPLFAP